MGRLAQVAVGAAQQVVGAQLLVGGAVAVVEVGHFAEDAGRGQRVVALVAGVGQEQLVVHAVGRGAERHRSQQREGRVGTRLQQAVGSHEPGFMAGVGAGCKEHQRQ